MPAKKPSHPDEKPQSERFMEAAKQVGASEDPAEFERVFGIVIKDRPEKERHTGSNRN